MSHLAACLSSVLLLSSVAGAQDWPRWRGPLGTGEAPDASPPLRWSDDENIRWKVEIPGRGNGTPIVWGEHVFVLTAEPFGPQVEAAPASEGRRSWMRSITPTHKQRFQLLALSRKDGSVAWSRTAVEALPHEGTHGDGTWASSSAVTDGERLYAFFGSRGLYAYDMKGEKLWEKQFGEMRTSNGFGEGSTPALHGDTIVVQWDHEGPSFLVALDAETGEEKWRTEREEGTSWSTPLITEVDGEAQVITGGTPHLRGYDLKTGKELWRCAGLGTNVIPHPVRAGDAVLAMSGHRQPGLIAVRLPGAKGDLTESDALLWSKRRDTSYVPSPLLIDGRVYVIKQNSGILSCFDATSGEAVFGPERLETVANVYASPVATKDRIYIVGRDGETVVLARGAEHELLATNILDDAFDASPALAGAELYLRGAQHLYCIAEDEKDD